jgi:hypothetical protein
MKNKLFLALALFLSTWGPGCVEFASAATGSGNVSDVVTYGGNSTTSQNAQFSISKSALTANGTAPAPPSARTVSHSRRAQAAPSAQCSCTPRAERTT